MSLDRLTSDLEVGDVFLVSPGGVFPHERVLVCRVAELRGDRLRARVLDGRWTATLCRRTGGDFRVQGSNGAEHPLPHDWRVSHAMEMSAGVARLAELGDHEGLAELAFADRSVGGLMAA